MVCGAARHTTPSVPSQDLDGSPCVGVAPFFYLGEFMSADRMEWLKERQNYLGASDMPAVLGYSPYKTALDIYESKFGDPVNVANKAMIRGQVLEASVLRAYELRTEWETEPTRHCIHKTERFMAATPDAFVFDPDRGRGLVQIKTAHTYTENNWGEEGTDDIPLDYAIQEVHEMAVTDCDFADVAVLFADEAVFDLLVAMVTNLKVSVDRVAAFILNLDFRIYHLERDIESEKELIEEARSFWDDYVLTKTEPPNLETMNPATDIRPATEEEYELMVTAREAYQTHRKADKAVINIGRKIQIAIGADSGFYDARVGKATWTRNKAKTEKVIDWESLARGMMIMVGAHDPTFSAEDNIKLCTKEVTTQGDRILRLPWARWTKDLLPKWLGGMG